MEMLGVEDSVVKEQCLRATRLRDDCDFETDRRFKSLGRYENFMV